MESMSLLTNTMCRVQKNFVDINIRGGKQIVEQTGDATDNQLIVF